MYTVEHGGDIFTFSSKPDAVEFLEDHFGGIAEAQNAELTVYKDGNPIDLDWLFNLDLF